MQGNLEASHIYSELAYPFYVSIPQPSLRSAATTMNGGGTNIRSRAGAGSKSISVTGSCSWRQRLKPSASTGIDPDSYRKSGRISPSRTAADGKLDGHH